MYANKNKPRPNINPNRYVNNTLTPILPARNSNLNRCNSFKLLTLTTSFYSKRKKRLGHLFSILQIKSCSHPLLLEVT